MAILTRLVEAEAAYLQEICDYSGNLSKSTAAGTDSRFWSSSVSSF
jgi:hypothetical protein